jgi:hypothetical protein
MTKQDLKSLIKEVLSEVEKLTPEEAADPSNVVAKQLYTALKANPVYKNVRVTYLTIRSEGAGASVFGYIGKAGEGNPYVFIDVYNDKISVNINDSYSGKKASREFTNVADAIKYLKNPLSAFKSSSSSSLKGATITRVVDLGDQGIELVITTKDGKQIAGEFHITN